MIGKRSVGIASNPLFWHEVNYLVDDPWQNTIERECLKTFIRLMPQYLWSKIVIVGDRGFGDDPLYIVTDLSDSSLVLEICGYRMRIEEGFRDFQNERYFSLRVLLRLRK
ncbi:MAG: hypothetical protein ABIL86_01640 [candidate division WOR-3 bacterium]